MCRLSDERLKEIKDLIANTGVTVCHEYKGDRKLYDEVYKHYLSLFGKDCDDRIADYLLNSKLSEVNNYNNYNSDYYIYSIDELNNKYNYYISNSDCVEDELDFVIYLLMWLDNKEE